MRTSYNFQKKVSNGFSRQHSPFQMLVISVQLAKNLRSGGKREKGEHYNGQYDVFLNSAHLNSVILS